MIGTGAEAAPFDDVVRTLSARDPVACSRVDASVDTLRQVVDTVSMPPWVPMRAAQCLVEGHAAEIEADLTRWVVDPADKGLGLLVLAEIDRLPTDLAVRIATKAVTEGPDRERAAARVADAASPEVRAVVSR